MKLMNEIRWYFWENRFLSEKKEQKKVTIKYLDICSDGEIYQWKYGNWRDCRWILCIIRKNRILWKNAIEKRGMVNKYTSSQVHFSDFILFILSSSTTEKTESFEMNKYQDVRQFNEISLSCVNIVQIKVVLSFSMSFSMGKPFVFDDKPFHIDFWWTYLSYWSDQHFGSHEDDCILCVFWSFSYRNGCKMIVHKWQNWLAISYWTRSKLSISCWKKLP